MWLTKPSTQHTERPELGGGGGTLYHALTIRPASLQCGRGPRRTAVATSSRIMSLQRLIHTSNLRCVLGRNQMQAPHQLHWPRAPRLLPLTTPAPEIGMLGRLRTAIPASSGLPAAAPFLATRLCR